MDTQTTNVIISGLISYLGLIVLLTFHEFGHAWTASKCGDDTARLMGRCSLNPLVHIDPIGTILLPLIMTFSSGGMIGWAKPVPVNPFNLTHPRRDDILVSLAGPGMNVVLAIGLVALARVGVLVHAGPLIGLCVRMAALSLVLCFFNLIPIPPLDGSHLLRNVTGMSDEAYYQFARFGFLAVILLLQIPFMRDLLNLVTYGTLAGLIYCFHFPGQ